MTQGDTKFLVLLGVIIVAMIVYALIEARHNREKKRSARVLEAIELRLDHIEATMRVLPQLMLEAYDQLEKRRGPGGRK